MREPVVYFIKPIGFDGPIKIGVTSNRGKRLPVLCGQSPFPLETLLLLSGDTQLERRFHARFETDRSHGEWFKTTPELLDMIEQIKAGTFDFDSLPEPRRLPQPMPGRDEQWGYAHSVGCRISHLLRRGLPTDEVVALFGEDCRYYIADALKRVTPEYLAEIRPTIDEHLQAWTERFPAPSKVRRSKRSATPFGTQGRSVPNSLRPHLSDWR